MTAHKSNFSPALLVISQRNTRRSITITTLNMSRPQPAANTHSGVLVYGCHSAFPSNIYTYPLRHPCLVSSQHAYSEQAHGVEHGGKDTATPTYMAIFSQRLLPPRAPPSNGVASTNTHTTKPVKKHRHYSIYATGAHAIVRPGACSLPVKP